MIPFLTDSCVFCFYFFLCTFHQPTLINLVNVYSIAHDTATKSVFLYLLLKIFSFIGIHATSYTHQFFPSILICKTCSIILNVSHIAMVWFLGILPSFSWRRTHWLNEKHAKCEHLHSPRLASILCLNFCWDLIIDHPCLQKTLYTLSFKQQTEWFFIKQWHVSSKCLLKTEFEF